jgi:hypothetical protein
MYRWQFNFDVNSDNTIHTIHWKYANLGQTETDLQNKLTTKLNEQINPQMTKKEKTF